MMTDLFSLKGETAVITGGASGIGYAIAEGYMSYGANVVLADINAGFLQKAKENLRENKCAIFMCDVSDMAQVRNLRDYAIERFGNITILVNSHGISRRAFALDMTEKEYDDVIRIDQKSLFVTMSVIGKYMVENKKGSIINVSSIGGRVCLPRNVNYCAAKAAVEGMNRAFGGEWAKYNVRVNGIAPGPCRTAFTEALYNDEEYVKQLTAKIPREIIPDAAEMVGPAIMLASRASSNIIGQTIVVDGGYTIM